MDILSEIINAMQIKNEVVGYNQKGYVGKSMSVRAKQAYDGGEMPKSKWSKNAIIDALSEEFGEEESLGFKRFSKEQLFDGIMKQTSWHHTGKFANATNFYSLDRERAISFAEDNNIESMKQTISSEKENKIRKKEKEEEEDKKAREKFQKMEKQLELEKEKFISSVKDTLTEPEEESNGVWMISFKSHYSDRAKRRFLSYDSAKKVYDRLMLGKNDPDLNKDDFWDRMFYARGDF